MDKSSSQRNITVDILRGIAMLLVVLGHTLTGCIEDAEHNFVFNIIWALQMPLFILISGYVTKYSKPISDVKALWKVIKKRTIAYMLPWLIWTFGVRGLVLGHYEYLNLKWLAYHMDSGYWFLFTIWVISFIYSTSVYIANKVNKEDGIKNVVAFTVSYGCFSLIVLGVGLLLGFSFLGTKLTMYYLPFYFCGVIFGRYQHLIEKHQGIKDVSIALALIVFNSIISRFYLYDLDETIGEILIRIIASISGCIAICGLVGPLCKKSTQIIWGGFGYIGTHSLEIYLTHYIFLSPIKHIAENTIESIWIPTANFLMTVLLCVVTVVLMEQNRVLTKIIYGKEIRR